MNKSLKKQVWLNVDHQVYGQFFGQSGVRVYGRICTKIWDEVRTQVYDQVFQAKDSLHQVIKKKDNIKMRTSKSLKYNIFNNICDKIFGEISLHISHKFSHNISHEVSNQVYIQVYDEVCVKIKRSINNEFLPTLGK
jgi:hypothetical protein